MVALRMREAMDFDPSRVFCVAKRKHGQKGMDECMASYDIPLPCKIEVKW